MDEPLQTIYHWMFIKFLACFIQNLKYKFEGKVRLIETLGLIIQVLLTHQHERRSHLARYIWHGSGYH